MLRAHSDMIHTRFSTRIVPKTVVEQVHDAILERVLARTFRPGDRITETTLARELGVSQATVNQALFDLDAKGIVSKTPNKETRIRCLCPEDIGTLFKIRKILEGFVGEAVAKDATRQTELSLGYWVERMDSALKNDDTPGFYIADYRFHQELHRQSGSPVLIRACQAIALAPFAYLLSGQTDRLLPIEYPGTVNDHQEIVEAVMTSPAKAVEVIHLKIEKWLDNVRSHLGQP